MYEIVRFMFKGDNEVLGEVDMEGEAQNICKDPEGSSRTCKKAKNLAIPGPWFVGYREVESHSYEIEL